MFIHFLWERNMRFFVCLFTVALLLAVNANEQEENDDVRRIINPSTGGSATVEYTYGVPFITASNEEDLFYTQGFIVSENRLWQMEIFRRWGLGTLSEIFPNALSLDIESRRMQWVQVCNKNIANTPQLYLNRIQYYINGVNAYLATMQADPSQLPPEFSQYGAPFPDEYTILDTFILVKVLASGLSGDARSEPRNQAMMNTLGLKRFNQYFARDPGMPYIVPPYSHSNYSKAGSDVPKGKAQILTEKEIKDATTCPNIEKLLNYHNDGVDDLPLHPIFSKEFNTDEKYLDSELGRFLKSFNPEEFTRASNSWAVGGEHTDTNLPIFANDPHLVYLAPSIWVLVGLHIPNSEWNHVIGATLILAPGVGIGRNEHISWGYTMVQSDNSDLYVMDNLPGNRAYRYNGTVMSYDITWEYINIKDSEPYNITLYRSIYGPTIPDSNGVFYSLHWTAQDAIEPSIQAIMDQSVARNSDEYLQAVSKWWSLCFNAVYADKLGNIGYHTSGAIPERKPADTGRLPKPGDGSLDWIRIAPFEELPNFVNPEEGYIVTANNPPARPSDETFTIDGYFAPGFRAQRIIDMIEDRINNGTNNKIDVDYMSSIQGSVVNLEFSYLYSTVENLVLT